MPGEGVRSYPGVGDGDAGSNAEARQVGRQGALQQVGAPTHSIFCLAHIQALGKETRVVRCLRSGAKRVEYKMSFLLTYNYMLFDQLCLSVQLDVESPARKRTSNHNQNNSEGSMCLHRYALVVHI